MKSYPKVWFLRHGETEWNAEGRVQGQTESVLSERGRVHAQQQAKLMAPDQCKACGTFLRAKNSS